MKKNVVWLLTLSAFGLFTVLLSVGSLVAQPTESISLRLASGTFDPLNSSAQTVALRGMALSQVSPEGEQFYLVQFSDTISENDKMALEAAGAEIFDYIPDFAFLVRMDEAAETAVSNLDAVRWLGTHDTAFRIAPDLAEEYIVGGGIGLVSLVAVVPDTAEVARMKTAVEALGGSVTDTTTSGWQGTLWFSVDAAQISSVAALDAISWVEAAPQYTLHNSAAVGVTGISTIRTNNGLFGEGQIVAVADSGFDQGVITAGATMHQDFEDHSNGSRVIALIDNTSGGDADVADNTTGHGTHVAGSVLGNGLTGGSTSGNYAGTEAGVAPQAWLYFQAINDSGLSPSSASPPTDLNDLFQPAYTAGARIHTNSWGADVAGVYNTNSRNADEFSWDNKDLLILFSAGNNGVDTSAADGVIDLDSMGAPGTAKNVLTVGASENNRPSISNAWNALFPGGYPTAPIAADRAADDTNGMAAFSSRGFTDDGRVKPDIVAPGTWINSTCAQPECGSANQYGYKFGTSMSTPHVAGAAALLREYFVKQQFYSPSAALMKAMLLNQATDMNPGQYGTGATQEITLTRPSPQAGWGLLNLDDALFPIAPREVWWWDHSDTMQSNLNNLSTGGTVTYTFEVTQTMPLNILMAWTDYPGSAVASGGLVNDLDMVLEAPGGGLHYPNQAAASGESTLNYDDAEVAGYFNGFPAGTETAVRFTPLTYPATLNAANLLLGTNTTGSKDFAVDVYDDNAGLPGTQICSVPQTMSLDAGSTTVRVDLSTCDGGSAYVINSGDFYIAYRYVNAEDPGIYVETSVPLADRGYYSTNSGTSWSSTALDSFDLMIGAVFAEPATNQDRVNNVIGIDLAAPATGTYTLTVSGYNVPQGPQPYALTISAAGRLLGSEQITMPINGTGTYIFGNTGISMTFNSENIDTVTVEVRRDTFPTTQLGDSVVRRYYDITTAGGTGVFNADVSFDYATAELNGQTAGSLQMFRHNGAAWQTAGGTVDTANRQVTVTGVTAFSPWVFGTATPTAIGLATTSGSVNGSLVSVLATLGMLLLLTTAVSLHRKRTN